MKKINLVYAMANILLLFVFACKDDNENGGTQASLEGKWSITMQSSVIKDASGNIISEEDASFAVNFYTIEF